MSSPYQLPPTQANIHDNRSKSHLILGVILSGLSIFLLGISIAYIPNIRLDATPICGIIGAIYHLVLGILTYTGGNGNNQQRCLMMSSLGMGIVGSLLFTLPVIIVDIILWSDISTDCDYACQDPSFYFVENCQYCTKPYGNYFLFILIISLLMAAIDVTISGIDCAKLCSCCCCYENQITNSGVVINQPYPPVNSGQYPTNYQATGLAYQSQPPPAQGFYQNPNPANYYEPPPPAYDQSYTVPSDRKPIL